MLSNFVYHQSIKWFSNNSGVDCITHGRLILKYWFGSAIVCFIN